MRMSKREKSGDMELTLNRGSEGMKEKVTSVFKFVVKPVIILCGIGYIIVYLCRSTEEVGDFIYQFVLAILTSFIVYYITSVYPKIKNKILYTPTIINELEHINNSIETVWIDITKDTDVDLLDVKIEDADDEVIRTVYNEFRFFEQEILDEDTGERLCQGQYIGLQIEEIKKRLDKISLQYAEYLSQDCKSAFLLMQYLQYDIYASRRIGSGYELPDELLIKVIKDMQKSYIEIQNEINRFVSFQKKKIKL